MSGAPRRLVVEADGGSRGNPGPAGYGTVVRDAGTGALLAERAAYLGVVSNNVAEYSGLIAGLEAARGIDPGATVEVRMDSRLAVEQMSGRWKIKHADMRRLADAARAVVPEGRVTYVWVPRAENSAADALANEAMDTRGTVVRDHPGREPLRLRRPSGAAMRFDDEEPLSVVLVRHGETPMTTTKAYSGSAVPGPGLTSAGRIQAAQAADLTFRIGRTLWADLPHPSELLTSPMVRAQQTAAAIGRRTGLAVEVDPAFAECEFGQWEGLTAEEIEERWPGDLKRWHLDAAARAPGGESIEDVGARMRAGLEALRAAGVGRTVVVVTHCVSVRSAVGVAIAADPSAWARIRVAPASVSIIRLWSDGASEVTVVGAPSGA